MAKSCPSFCGRGGESAVGGGTSAVLGRHSQHYSTLVKTSEESTLRACSY